MLNVFLTIDTEIWPRSEDLSPHVFRAEFDRDIHGWTPRGSFGLEFQMSLLNEFGLKGVFFVESLFAGVVGLGYLSEIVDTIQSRGHEVQLHLHTEWLDRMSGPPVKGRTSPFLKDFSPEDQSRLIGTALHNLEASGVRRLTAFRSGNYGADGNTMAALAQHGLLYDTSFDAAFADRSGGLCFDPPLLQPKKINGIWEIPITVFQDRPDRIRHLQLAACSFDEIRHVLLQAWKQGWGSVVIVSHSFELQKRSHTPGVPAQPDRIMIRRFWQLCEFLAAHREWFSTRTFNDLDPSAIQSLDHTTIIRSGCWRTVKRMSEQALRRCWS